MVIRCISCLAGFPWECAFHGNCGRDDGIFNNSDNSTSDLPSGSIYPVPLGESGDLDNGRADEERSDIFEGDRGPVREVNTYKQDSSIRDQQSTGRKRAAVMYPLMEGAECEWTRQKNCGGGSKPIVGCVDGKQEARHHGPDKNTLNNDGGNVHRICHKCHNRWHTKNDENYVWGSLYPPHSPMPATMIDIMENEALWASVKTVKAKD